MDPLSAFASVLAVAGLATTSCEFLCKALRLFSEAQEDLHHHIAAVQALQSTLADIAALEEKNPNAGIITPEFNARLRACLLDLQAMEKLARSFHAQIEEGRARKAWAKLRWSSAAQRHKLKKHLRRIDSYHRSLSTDLLVLNTRLGLRHANRKLSIHKNEEEPLDLPIDRSGHPLGHGNVLQNSRGHHSERVSLRSSILRYVENGILPVLLWLGPTTVQRWQNDQNAQPDTLDAGQGFGIALAIASSCYFPFRLELMVFLTSYWRARSASFSIRWNLFCPRIVSWDAGIVDVASRGDIDALKREFSARRSTPFDVLPNGLTLLHLAASHGRYGMVQFLLLEGARVNAMSNFGESPLHSAIALSKNYDIARILLDHGGDLQNRDADGRTPLHTFPSQVSEQILRCHGLLFDFSTQDHRGMSPLHYLAWSSKTSRETFKSCHERSSVDLSIADAEGRSMLHLAAQRGNLPVIEYILHAGKDFDMDHSDSRGRTVLHYGVENKRASDTVTALVSHGASIRARDRQERSPLHHAAKQGNLQAIKALLALGMAEDLQAADCFGMVPIMIAAHHKSHAVQAYLAELEPHRQADPQRTVPGLLGSREKSSNEIDSLSLSSVALKRHLDLPVRLQQVYYLIDEGCKGLWRMLHHSKDWLSDISILYTLVKPFAVIFAIWIFVLFISKM